MALACALRAACGALCAGQAAPLLTQSLRHITSSASSSQAQPQLQQPVEDTSRWQRELGAIRTDWT
jgi:hypothetical protein